MITLSDTPVLQFMSPNLQSHIHITGENLQRCLTQYLNRHSVQNASVRVHGVSQLPTRLLTILWSLILILTTLRHFSFVLLQKMKLRMLIRASNSPQTKHLAMIKLQPVSSRTVCRLSLLGLLQASNIINKSFTEY